MDPTARFAELMAGPDDSLTLDEPALLIAAHAHPELDVDAELARLDELAAGCPEATFEGWRRHLFGDLGFTGDGNYANPANSYLDDVMRRRRGLPITLSVLGMEVGRRIGVELVGVGMPGHFLLRSLDHPSVFVDPFHGGRLLDRDGCAARFSEVNGDQARFSESYLRPSTPKAVVARILANLRAVFASGGDVWDLRWVLELRQAIPGVPVVERRDRARVRAATGDLLGAAEELEDLASALPDLADSLEKEAVGFRARLN